MTIELRTTRDKAVYEAGLKAGKQEAKMDTARLDTIQKHGLAIFPSGRPDEPHTDETPWHIAASVDGETQVICESVGIRHALDLAIYQFGMVENKTNQTIEDAKTGKKSDSKMVKVRKVGK